MEYLKNEEKKKFEKSMIKATIAGVSIASLIAIAAFSYKVNKENNFTRVVSENGDYELEGFISYDRLANHKVIEIETITGENIIYITRKSSPGAGVHHYYDIFTDKLVGFYSHESEDSNVVSATDVSEFLIVYDMIKAKYSEDDIEYLLDKINEDYQNNENLKLVKTKDK